jgi:hypothetical protein
VAGLEHHVDVVAVDERRLEVRQQERLIAELQRPGHLVPDERVVENVDEVPVERLPNVRDVASVLRVGAPLRPLLRHGRRGKEQSYQNKRHG